MERNSPNLILRAFRDADWPSLWPVVQEVAAAGDSFPYDPDIDEAEARKLWLAPTHRVYVGELDGAIVATYHLKPNQYALGAHVVNAGYMVAGSMRGRGIGRQLCVHSLREAQGFGYLAMQYNLVVSTNQPALRLYHSLGFRTIGTLPQAFRHLRLGLVDAHILHRFV